MPVPKPMNGEKQKDFIGRCISTLKKSDPNRADNQISAMCHMSWEDNHREDNHDEDNLDIVNFKLTPKNYHDIETVDQENGILLKGVPIFKAGTHRGQEYDEKYIDEKLIGGFKQEENIPVQADHSDSFEKTLGYIKNLTREGKMLFADLHLIDDNAISRWKKGLMKKWSASIYRDGRGLREVSAVAFPYIKEASVLSDADADEDLHVVKTDGDKAPKIKKEVIEIEAQDIRNKQNKKGKLQYNEDTSSYSLIVEGEEYEMDKDIEGDILLASFADWTQAYKNDLPDSAFALVKHPVTNKSTDRALPYKDKNGNIDPAHVRNALARINQVKGFSAEEIASAKRKLLSAAKSIGIKTEEKLNEGGQDMDEKKIDELAELKAQKLLEEASKKEEKFAEELEAKNKDIELKDKEIETLKSEKTEFEKKLDLVGVKEQVFSLKQEGKVLPAEEGKVVDFMVGLNKEQREKYVEMLKATQPKVDLKESGTQESKKDGEIEDKYKVDFDTNTPEEIETIIEQYSKDKGVPLNDARDIIYDKYAEKK